MDRPPQPDERHELSRRQAIVRLGAGAAGVGMAAWMAPEILSASPAGAAPGSPQPGNGHGHGHGGSGGQAGISGSGSVSGSASGGAGGNSGSVSGSGSASATLTAADTAFDRPAASGLHHNVEQLAEAGATLAAGGWLVHRWASRGGPAPTSSETVPPR